MSSEGLWARYREMERRKWGDGPPRWVAPYNVRYAVRALWRDGERQTRGVHSSYEWAQLECHSLRGNSLLAGLDIVRYRLPRRMRKRQRS